MYNFIIGVGNLEVTKNQTIIGTINLSMDYHYKGSNFSLDNRATIYL